MRDVATTAWSNVCGKKRSVCADLSPFLPVCMDIHKRAYKDTESNFFKHIIYIHLMVPALVLRCLQFNLTGAWSSKAHLCYLSLTTRRMSIPIVCLVILTDIHYVIELLNSIYKIPIIITTWNMYWSSCEFPVVCKFNIQIKWRT